MTTRTGALCALLVATLAACDNTTAPSGVQDNTAQHQRFRALVGGSYSYEFQRQCFCAPPVREPVRIVVRRFEIESVTRLDGSPVAREDWSLYRTVDELFAEIDEAYAGHAAGVNVRYDAALGYPAETAIDISQQIADEERYYEVRGLSALP